MRTQDWTVVIHLSEDDTATHAHAVLHTRDGIPVHTHGSARRNPHDAQVPEIGEELAASRAMNAMADRLMDIANRDIQAVTHPAYA